MSEEETQAGQTHEAIISERDAQLAQLNSEVSSNPQSQWRDYEVCTGLTVKLPSRAIIEGEALVKDVSSNLKLFKEQDSIVYQDHADILRDHHDIYYSIYTAIHGSNRDWEGIKAWVLLRRGMSLCEKQMDGNIRPGYDDILTSFDQIENGLTTLVKLKPLPGMENN